MERQDIVNRFNGMLLSRAYVRPVDYKAEHMTRADWRKQYIAQTTKKERATRRKAKEA